MKIRKILICMLAVCLLSTCFAGCNRDDGGNNTVINDGKTINIRTNNQGLGYAYVEAMCNQFNETFADDGYRANLLAPIEGMGEQYIYQDIYQGNSGVDIYIASADMKGGVDGDYNDKGPLFEDITNSVYKQKPIKFDKSEESETVEEKLDGLTFLNSYGGKYYGLPYVLNISGLAVNKKLLDGYGLQLPKTTKEYAHCIEEIMKKAYTTNVFPFTYSVGDNNYSLNYVNLWMAQYGGIEEYDVFWSMENPAGTKLDNPADVFNHASIKPMLEDFIRIFDYNTAAFGAETQTYKDAQKQLYRGEAVFYTSGDWLYNEEKTRNASYLNDVVFIRMPMISALGTKLFGAGTSYGFDEDKCESVLREIIDGADANKSVDDITAQVNAKLSVSLDKADVKTVCERRGYACCNNSLQSVAVVSSKSQVKDLCALFLRMWTSDEGASLIANTFNSCNPFNLSALSDSQIEWCRSTADIMSNRYFRQLVGIANGYRRENAAIYNVFTLTGLRVHSYVLSNHRVTMYQDNTYNKTGNDSVYKNAAATMAEAIYAHAKNYSTLR